MRPGLFHPAAPRRKIALIVLTDGERTPRVFPKIEITVGSGERCDLRCDGADEIHCLIALTKQGYVVEDLGSSTGTFVGKRRIERAYVDPGQVVRVGRNQLILLPL